MDLPEPAAPGDDQTLVFHAQWRSYEDLPGSLRVDQLHAMKPYMRRLGPGHKPHYPFITDDADNPWYLSTQGLIGERPPRPGTELLTHQLGLLRRELHHRGLSYPEQDQLLKTTGFKSDGIAPLLATDH